MANYKVNHQNDFIKIPFSDAYIDSIENPSNPLGSYILIKPNSIEALDRIIEQGRDLKLSIMEKENLR